MDDKHILEPHDILIQGVFGVVTHPLAHARILMQVGYEPARPELSHTFLSMMGLGPKRYRYPSVFVYWRVLKQEIGYRGLFLHGLPARLLHILVARIGSDCVLQKFRDIMPDTNDRDATVKDLAIEIGVNSSARLVGVAIAYPFQVVLVRQVAQIVGKENIYGGLFHTISQIWHDEGFAGFYGGFGARALTEVVSIAVISSGSFLLMQLFSGMDPSSRVKQHANFMIAFMCGNYMYKFQVVSTMMALSGSRLLAAIPFNSSFEAYNTLRDMGALSRGSSLLLRYVVAPI